jgi:hypothetical protein
VTLFIFNVEPAQKHSSRFNPGIVTSSKIPTRHTKMNSCCISTPQMMYTANDSPTQYYPTEMTSTTTYLKPLDDCCEVKDENSITVEGLHSSDHSMSSCEVKDKNSITGYEGLNSSNCSMSSFMSGLLAERAMEFETSTIYIVDDNARSEYDRRSMNLVKVRRSKSSIGLNRWGGDSDDQQPKSRWGGDSDDQQPGLTSLPCYNRRSFPPSSSSSAAPLKRASASDTMLLKLPVRRESPRIIKPLLGKASNTNFRWDQSNAAALRMNKLDLLFEDNTKRKTSSSTTTTTTTTTGLKKSSSSSTGLKKSSSSSSGFKSSGKKKSSKGLKDRAHLLGLDLK